MTSPPQVILEQSLPSARGMCWKDAYRGQLSTAHGSARVRLGATGGARIEVHVGPKRRPCDALACNAGLPLNLRYAGATHRRHLAADVWLDRSAFVSSVSEFRRGVRRAATASRVSRPTAVGEPAPYKELFDELARLDQRVDVVERVPEWELGPRIRGARIAVRVTPERGGLRLHRVVLKRSELGDLEEGPRGDAIADAALRFNVRARFVRLALHESGVAVEARLATRLADTRRVSETAQAIAVVSTRVKPLLEILTYHEDVARCYADIFHLSNGDPAP